MAKPLQILLQTTIPTTEDDWNIERFSLLRDYLAALKDEAGDPLCVVTARDRENDPEGNDPVLSTLGQSQFDELWLFAVDVGDGLTEKDCDGINQFRQGGGGILAARDHQDLGSSLCKLSGVCHALGSAHFFHSLNQEPDPSRHCADDQDTKDITWPNYHSGRNGDFQQITPTQPVHDLVRNSQSLTGVIQYFPAHPHEGAVGAPETEAAARVVATGKSLVSGRPFNLAVAFERSEDRFGNLLGRAVASSTFHHFCDYNWDPEKGCPTFVSEAPGDGIAKNPEALQDIYTYMKNLVLWLAPHPQG
jgi:hypothetical protein